MTTQAEILQKLWELNEKYNTDGQAINSELVPWFYKDYWKRTRTILEEAMGD